MNKFARTVNKFPRKSICFRASQYVSAQRSKVSALTKMFPHPQVIFRGALTKLKRIKNNSTLNIYIYAEFLPKRTAIGVRVSLPTSKPRLMQFRFALLRASFA